MQRIRVLLVDDEADLLKLLSRRLIRRDMEVNCVESGEAAVQAVQDQTFDVVVLDMKMPGMGGMAALEKIRQLAPHTRVIILTGHANTESAMHGMDLGAFDYMLKPVEVDDLLFRIQDAVRAPGAGQ